MKTLKLHPLIAIPLMLAIMAFSLGLVWCIYAGLHKAGGWTAIIAYIVVFGQVTSNGRTYTLINDTLVRGLIGTVVSIGAILGYLTT